MQVSPKALARDFSTLITHFLRDSEPFRLVGELDLSVSQFKTLMMLERDRSRLTLGEVAEEMGLSLPAASRAVDGLCRRGYIERREDEADRRVKRIGLTEEGAKIVATIADARIAAGARFLAKLTEDERAALADALAPALARVRAEEEQR